ncbi:MAG TPA: DUF885 domain-containing protein [Gemmatimonadaceae bacterium]|nr:DUF885 domain-containing protein [Gemmatimonadaceae bacterium]
MRSNHLVVALVAVTACTSRLSPVAVSRDGASVALRVAADSFLAVNQPATPGRVWADLSDPTRIESRRRVDRVASSLRRIDRGTLSSPTDQLLYDNLRESAESAIGARVCNTHLWAISNQFGGWHVAASNAARVQPVGTDDARARALSVVRALPAAIDAERALLQRGLDSGYTASRDVIETVIRQYDDLLPPDPTRSPLYAPANRDSTSGFRAAWRSLLADTIYPAARAHQAFLRDRYVPRARADGSLSTLPNGRHCYAATLRARTSVEVEVDTIMRNARRELDRITAELAPLVRELTGDANVSRGVIRLRDDPRFTFPTRDSVLAAYRAMTVHAATRIGRVVARFQPESIVVTPYPEFQERANLPPQYLRAPEDGSRPAQFLVNLARMERMSVANAVAHEAYPGHHLQRIAARRGPAVHPVMRDLSFGGFTEGWGIYAERLGDEMGLYVTPLDRAGYLVHLLDVAAAAYLDIGYHARGWSQQQLVDSMVVLGGRSPAMAGAYADRHAATPGQLATYYIGFEAIRSYREAAERALGTRFRSPEFHHEVLKDGTITLASLGAKVDRWVAAHRD